MYRKFKIPKLSHIVGKTSVLSIIYGKCASNNENVFIEKNHLRY